MSFIANAQYLVDFEGDGETKTSYASATVSLSGLEWDLTETLIGTSAADFKNGDRSARLRGYGESSMTMLEDKLGGVGFITFEYRRYGTDAQVDWRVEYSSDGGESWLQVGSSFTAPSTDDVQVFSEQLDVEGPVRFRIKRETETGGSNRRLNIDDILVSDFGAAGDPSLAVSSPAQSLVLSPLTTSTTVNLNILNFSISSSATANDGDGYVQYSLNQSPFEDVFTNSFLLEDLNPGAYSLIVKLVDNNGADLDPAVQVTRDFSIAAFTEVADISALRADVAENGPGGFYEITGASIFIHGDNFNNRKWFQDNNGGGIQLFDNQAIIANGIFNVGDNVIGLRGATSVFNGVLQFSPLDNSATVNGNTVPNVSIISMQEYTENFQNYESTLIGIENVTYAAGDGTAVFANGQNYTIEAGELSVIHRTDFFNVDYIGELIPQGMIEGIRGIANSFNGTPQILVRNAADIDVTLNTVWFDRNEFSIYPNPTNGIVNFVAPRGEKFSVEVYNVLGRRVLSTKLEGTKKINVQNFQSGVYLVKFTQGRQNYTRKLIIK